MGFFEAVNAVFAGYFKFSGRARRSEFWWFFLFEAIVFVVLLVVDVMLVMRMVERAGGDPAVLLNLNPFDLMVVYYGIISFVPRLTVTIRRLHDAGFSGFFYLLNFIPFVGTLIVLVLLVLPSEEDDNIHGPFNRSGGRGPGKPGGAPHDPMQGYAVLFRANAPVTPEMQADRKAEVRALYEQRVLGMANIPAE